MRLVATCQPWSWKATDQTAAHISKYTIIYLALESPMIWLCCLVQVVVSQSGQLSSQRSKADSPATRSELQAATSDGVWVTCRLYGYHGNQ